MGTDDPAGRDLSLSTGAVARRLGVAATTLRSWERRYGIGPATRQDGRHRRWTPQDIGRIEEMCRLTAQGVPPAEAARAVLRSAASAEGSAPAGEPGPAEAAGPPGEPGHAEATGPAGESGPAAPAGPPAGGTPARSGGPGGRTALPLGNVRQECRGLARAALRLDAPAVEEILEAAVTEYGIVTAWEEVLAPTLHAVGRKWATSGERYVEVEHLLSWHVSSAVRRAHSTRGALPLAPALLACVPGEEHSLPLEALAAALAERRLPARMYGAALPAEALLEAVRRTGPSAVVLWAQSRSTADRALVQWVAGMEWGVRGARESPALLLAGPGWSGTAVPAGTGRLQGLRSAVGSLEALMRS
ncbi:MerR family transcriptional regulator [Streptomyces sp. NPDC047968]|uniref:MerR family transcriptional regulator n=1 Tax=unclassified Streptomyces TaxID=2593676 RepID=UPI00343B4228